MYCIGNGNTGLPVVTITPSIQRVEVTRNVTLLAIVTHTGLKIFNYQWRHNRRIVIGETSNFLVIHDITERDSGNYKCILSNEHINRVSSNTVKLIVTSA